MFRTGGPDYLRRYGEVARARFFTNLLNLRRQSRAGFGTYHSGTH